MSQAIATAPQNRKVFLDRFEKTERTHSKYTEATLKRYKSEGLELAVKARWLAMALIAVFLIYLNPHWDVLYYHAILAGLALNGWVMRRIGRIGHSRPELLLIFVDLALMTISMVLPNPLSESDIPLAMQYRLGTFQYFYVILAFGTLAYSWRTVISFGVWTSVMWGVGVGLGWWLSIPVPGLDGPAGQAFTGFPMVAELMDPNDFLIKLRIQEVVIFLIVAVTLGLAARRFDALLISNAGLERERANLSRYFSPNVVEELSQNDEPLKQIRTHDVAVLFIDIVGFTEFAASREATDVIELLRGFHGRMETEVFRHEGTLDKYLGDGLMATFGTPFAGERDATHALECAQAMVASIQQWNTERRRAGEPEIRAGIGLHYGSVVLADIGAHRLEFAVIGTTVNVSSRLETLTRNLKVRVVVSDALRDQVVRETTPKALVLDGLTRRPDQEIRGIAEPLTVWTLA